MKLTKAFTTQVRQTFAHYHNVTALAQSPLAQEATVSACLLEGDHAYADARGFVVRAMLDWTLLQLQKQATERALQSADVLQKRYLDGMSATEYADAYLISDATAQSRRRAAINRAAKILIQAFAEGNGKQWQERMLTLRYGACTAEQQKVLRFLSIFSDPVPLQLGEGLAGIALQTEITPLMRHNLVWTENEPLRVALQDPLRNTVRLWLDSAESQAWHTHAATYFSQQQASLPAIYHWQRARQMEKAARLLVAEHKAIPLAVLRVRLGEFSAENLDKNLWAELKLIDGWAAMLDQEVEAALKSYQQALVATDSDIKARAYYELARTYRQTDIDRALAHYAACRRHLADNMSSTGQHLLAQALISETWIFIEQRIDLARAQTNLTKTKLILNTRTEQMWLTLHSDLHNAQGQIDLQRGDLDAAAAQRWQAWQYAQEANDLLRTTNTTHNLGTVYYHQGKYDKAREFYEESKRLALSGSNDRMIALNEKGLGYCAFGSTAYASALVHYQEAYYYFVKNGHHFWQAATCYDLAETATLAGESLLGHRYWLEGETIAREDGIVRLTEAFQTLVKTYPELNPEYTERQRKAINFVRLHESINNATYREVFGVSKKSAENDLNALLAKQVLQKVGKARATRYTLRTDHDH